MGEDRRGKVERYRNIRRIWIMMIVIGPVLIFLSGLLMISSSTSEWIKILDEDDFEYESWEECYSERISGSELDEDLRISIESKNGTAIGVEFWIEDEYGWDEFRDKGNTPEYYEVDLGYVSSYDYYEFYLKIYEDETYDIDDLEVTIEKQGLPSSVFGFCAASTFIALLGLLLLVMGIIFVVVYSGRIREQDPEFIRQNMIRKQEMMMREQQARKAMEMERIRQRQAMLIRARNLESAFRLSEAAFLYERLDMYEDAGRCRRKKKEDVSRHIHVNANDLFDRLQKNGTAIPYLCPRCHGMVDIDGKKHRHTECPYCGAVIDFEILRRAAGNLLQ